MPGTMHRLEVTTPADTTIRMTRTFNAPAHLVFAALSRPEHVRRWWGLRESDMTVCEIDFRVGGKWRYVTREEDGTEVEFYGEYLEIVPAQRIVHTEIFAMFPDNDSTITTTFEERDGQTTITVDCEYESREVRDMVISSGMETGAAESYDRMEALLATLS